MYWGTVPVSAELPVCAEFAVLSQFHAHSICCCPTDGNKKWSPCCCLKQQGKQFGQNIIVYIGMSPGSWVCVPAHI